MRAGDIARSEYIAINTEATVLEAARTMVQHRMQALPVMNSVGQVHCILNVVDIISMVLPVYLDEIEDLSFLPASFEISEMTLPEINTLKVEELCKIKKNRGHDEICRLDNIELHTVEENESVLEVARMFVFEGVTKCVVKRGGQVIGMIEPLDLLEQIILHKQ